MIYNDIQEEITIGREELEKLWNNPEYTNADVIRILRELIKRRTGYEYCQKIIRGVFIAEGMNFRERRAKKVYPIKITENGIGKRVHRLTWASDKKGEWAAYKCIDTKKL